MGALPGGRLASFEPAFTNTAVDYFGPFVTSWVRGKTTKRYGALFTCLTTRAIYLDFAQSLSDFFLTFRRFLSLHKSPIILFSGNGTNFVGAEKEMKLSA